jgi:hypothetical protein
MICASQRSLDDAHEAEKNDQSTEEKDVGMKLHILEFSDA